MLFENSGIPIPIVFGIVFLVLSPPFVPQGEKGN
jgi:hypothetical protein